MGRIAKYEAPKFETRHFSYIAAALHRAWRIHRHPECVEDVVEVIATAMKRTNENFNREYFRKLCYREGQIDPRVTSEIDPDSLEADSLQEC